MAATTGPTAARPGRDGDFLTAPEAHPIFGAALARAVADAWDRLGRPAPFVAPRIRRRDRRPGARDPRRPARERPDLARRHRATTRSRSSPRRLDALAARLRGRPGRGDRLATPRPPCAARSTGVILANEVLDALPTHRVVGAADGLREILVGSDGDGASSTSRPTPTTPALAARLDAEGIDAGATASAPRSASRSMAGSRDAAAGLGRGLLLLIDYGYPAAELYDPVRRRDGHAPRVPAPPRPRRPVRPRRPPGPDRPRRRDRRRTGRGRGRPDHLGTTTQAEFLVGLGTEDAPPGDPGRPGDDARGLPRRPLGAHAAARPERDGPLPGHGLRPRLAGRTAAGGLRLPAPLRGRPASPRTAPTAPDRTGPHAE